MQKTMISNGKMVFILLFVSGMPFANSMTEDHKGVVWSIKGQCKK
jgi:hypothetical protein